MEEIHVDSSNNTITIRYDEETDKMTVNNSGINEEFHELFPLSVELHPNVITCAGEENNLIEGWSDPEILLQIQSIWDYHKKDKS